MADLNEKLKCPLCDGHGELYRDEMEEFLHDPQWQSRLMQKHREELAAVDASLKAAPSQEAGEAQSQNFAQRVHSWNPRMPIWSRSPKE